MDKKKRNEFALIAGLLLICLLCFAGRELLFSQQAAAVEVHIAGKIYASYNLTDDVDILLPGYNNGTNRLIVKDGGVSIIEATCPNHDCIRQGVKKEAGENITCIPNKVSVIVK